jgi:hypothetical protein
VLPVTCPDAFTALTGACHVGPPAAPAAGKNPVINVLALAVLFNVIVIVTEPVAATGLYDVKQRTLKPVSPLFT